MARHFNTAGICRPDDHFMLAAEARLGELRRLIDQKAYFVIHAPRQSGKTTSAQLLAEALTAEGTYAAVLASCKPGAVAGSDVERGIRAVLHSMDAECQDQVDAELRPPPPEELASTNARIRRLSVSAARAASGSTADGGSPCYGCNCLRPDRVGSKIEARTPRATVRKRHNIRVDMNSPPPVGRRRSRRRPRSSRDRAAGEVMVALSMTRTRRGQ